MRGLVRGLLYNRGIRRDHAGGFGRSSGAAIESPRYRPPAKMTGSGWEEDAARQEARFPPERASANSGAIQEARDWPLEAVGPSFRGGEMARSLRKRQR